ncbi:MAG TPA: MurR/RpiR family transcriptional regulator [Kiloniellales bacterium]|jgi:DNA-binding MurR/RpiR family transcriptional regulator
MTGKMAETLKVPKDFESLRTLVVLRRDDLPRRLAQVAEFALEHPDEVAFGTAAELADLAGVQPSTLVRFAQSFGFSGFSDLQAIFRARLRDRWPDYGERLKRLEARAQSGGTLALLDGFADAAIDSLARLREEISGADLDKAANLLAGARQIGLLGQRRVFPVVAYLAYACAKLGIEARLLDNRGGLLAEEARFLGSEDALLAVSFTPYTPETIEIAAEAAARGVPVVAITDSAFSPLTRSAQAWIEVVESDYGAFRSLSATLTVAIAIAVSAAEKRRAPAPAPAPTPAHEWQVKDQR